jgi:hypothetical protein
MAKGKEKSKGSKTKKRGDDAELSMQYKILKEKYDTLKANNTRLLELVNQLNLDKAELMSKNDTQGGGSRTTGQLSLSTSMVTSVRSLVQQTLFRMWPMMDKTMFQQGNVAAVVCKRLAIPDEDRDAYAVGIRRVCLQKTGYWREYCGEKVRMAYISE